MGEVAEAGGTVVDLSRARAGHIDQLCERLRRERRMHDDHQPGRIGDVDDRREVAQRVVRELAVDRWIDGVRPGRGQERVAVGRRARDEFGADDVVGAATLTLQSRKAPNAKDAKENPKKYEYRATIHASSVTPHQPVGCASRTACSERDGGQCPPYALFTHHQSCGTSHAPVTSHQTRLIKTEPTPSAPGDRTRSSRRSPPEGRKPSPLRTPCGIPAVSPP